MEKQVKAAIYARVSTTDKNQDVEVQTDILKEVCVNHGWQIYDYYTDEVSAKKHRPGLRRLLIDVKKKRVNIVLVTRIDRLARSVQDLLHIIDIVVRENEVRLWFTEQNLDVNPNSAVSMLTVQLLGAIAEFERALISERVKDG